MLNERDMPSGGALSNPNDQALVKGLEDKMINAYGTAIVELTCKGGRYVELDKKMREVWKAHPQHHIVANGAYLVP